jgi:glycosyltransferase involved in cell wall biosynthesis
MQISAVIIALNEERRLPGALESLAGVADEILVVDSGSTDRTVDIAAEHGARVLSQPWEGYSRQKNFAASQAAYPWILSLDADEVITPELAAELREIKEQGPGGTAGFRMPRLAWYRGRWIRHSGWYPDHKLRLYDRHRGRWVGDYVHERVEVDGPVRDLRGDLQHFTCDSLAEHFRTTDRYTTLAAKEAFATGPRAAWVLPRAVAMTVLAPPWKFIETYFVRQGFRDGPSGLVIAGMAGFYVFWKFAKLCEMLRDARGSETSRGREGAGDPGRL